MARRSAAQRRATRKLVAMNRARNRRSKPRRRKRSITGKITRHFTRRRRSKGRVNKKRRSSGSGMKIPFLNNPTVRKAAVGVGTATLAVTALSFVAPQISQNPLVRAAIAYFSGGVEGAAATFLLGGGLGGGNGGSSGGGAFA